MKKESNLMPEEFDFEEYQKIAFYVYNKHFKKFARYKDDLISSAFLRMWEYRHCLSKDIPKQVYLFNTAKWGMLDFLHKTFGDKFRPKINELMCISFDTRIDFDNEKFTISDLIGEDFSFEDSLNLEFLKNACYECKNKLKFNKNGKFGSQVIDLIIQGKPDAEIARIVGSTRERIRQIHNRFINILRKYLIDKDFF